MLGCLQTLHRIFDLDELDDMDALPALMNDEVSSNSDDALSKSWRAGELEGWDGLANPRECSALD